ncbi:hypothetical protein HMPREF0653_02608 [Prevotella disiens JCM 6334 = ATCC 29426]|uniref:Uncharacterized protein n=1 Tax=Prevotella disiens JCM 6334 = ATCC 29426 TaxID=1235811 RepID=A0ABN0NNU9_9BACT|nr:hypothetical protein HMPREF0653_02608 [Prevotella disiens JCM 6334 = ATCC 29426]
MVSCRGVIYHVPLSEYYAVRNVINHAPTKFHFSLRNCLLKYK